APPKPPVDIKQLLAELKNPNPQVQAKAAQGLGDVGAKAVSALPELVNLLKAGDPNVRAAAAEAIGKIGGDPKVMVPLLLNLLKTDQIPKVRASAAESLGYYGAEAESAVGALIAAFTDADQDVAVKAREALKRIRGAKK